jgi:hypothetical protein
MDCTRFEARTLCFKKVAVEMVQPCLGHLAAGAIVNADEQDSLFFHILFCSFLDSLYFVKVVSDLSLVGD